MWWPPSRRDGVLLDTRVWLWLLAEPERVRPEVQERLRQPATALYLSAVSTWEIAIKYRLGRLSLPEAPSRFVPSRMRVTSVRALLVTHEQAAAVADLPLHHRDPFDRLLVAQAQLEQPSLVTADPAMTSYDVEVVLAG